MALRVVDSPSKNFTTLGDLSSEGSEYNPSVPMTRFQDLYPGDYSGQGSFTPPQDLIGQSAIRNAPMNQSASTRYEDVMPYKPDIWQQTVRPQGAKQDYLNKAQKYNATQQQMAERSAIIESGLWKAVEAAPPGKRDTHLQIIQKYYKAKDGTVVDPSIVSFYKKADEDELKASRWAIQEIMKSNPEMKQDELFSSLNTDPIALMEWATKRQEYAKQQGLLEGLETKNKQAKEAFRQLRALDTEAPVSPVEPSSVQSISPQAERPYKAPGGEQQPLSIRLNNPYNIKLGPATSKWIQQGVAQPDQQATDGGHFLRFNSVEAGEQAGRDLLLGPGYQNLSVDAALKKWSNKGYGANIVKTVPGETLIKELTPVQLTDVMGSMRQAESGIPNYQREALNSAPPAAQQAVKLLNSSIDKDMKRIKLLAQMSGDPQFDKQYDNLTKLVEIKMKERDRIEAKVTPKFQADFEQYANTKSKIPLADLPVEQRDELRNEFLGEGVIQKTLEASAVSQATMGDRLQLAKEGNAANIVSPSESRNIYNTSGKGPIHPLGKTNSQLAAENQAAVEGGQAPMWEAKGPMPEADRKSLNDSISGAHAAQRVMKYMDDKNVTRLLGGFLSNPKGRTEVILDNTFGKGKVPAKYREMAAELSNLTSIILHARIGGAQTVGEYERLKPLIAQMTGANPVMFKAQMTVLHNAIAADFNTELSALEQLGIATPKDWKKLDLMKTAIDTEPPVAGTVPNTSQSAAPPIKPSETQSSPINPYKALSEQHSKEKTIQWR